MWQTDFTYLRVVGWGWYYLSTVMDDFSRFILSYRLSPTMAATDVIETLDDALARTGVDSCRVRHPQTQGKIERYHRSMKNVVKLEHHYFPWELRAAIDDFVSY